MKRGKFKLEDIESNNLAKYGWKKGIGPFCLNMGKIKGVNMRSELLFFQSGIKGQNFRRKKGSGKNKQYTYPANLVVTRDEKYLVENIKNKITHNV